ncbi:unnamed protein product [Alopecurus aequalis]
MPPRDGEDDGGGGDDERLFAGVRFALVGFDPVSESQYRSDMVRRGGADAGGYGEPGCTHVIVSGLVYDDPVCVAARGGGKKVVTELWVDNILDTGVMADADRALYRPVRDFNGIPGSHSLNICLTGYQKDGREGIMKMVSLMGAQFSKPLKADTVTHLICYKFEGEKYELAKMVNINLVNHQWLEDCLKAWEILPVDKYRKSGWEQEMMEAQVEDSEDEAEDTGRGLSHSRGIARSVPITEIGMRTHLDPDVRASIHDPTVSLGHVDVAAGRHLDTPEQVSKAEDVGKRSLDVRADIQSTHNTNGVTISADPEARNSAHPLIDPSSNEKAPGAHITRDEVKNGDKGPLDTGETSLSMLKTNGASDCGDHLLHQSTVIPPIPVVDTDNIDRKYLDNSNQFIVNNVHLPKLSAESLLEKPSQSSDMNGKVGHKDNGLVADLVAKVGQSNAEGNLTLFKANSISSGNSAPQNSPVVGYSRRRSRKSVSPGTSLSSAHQTASPQSFDRNTPNVEFSISPSRKSNHKISDLSDAKSLRDEAITRVDSSDCVLANTERGLSMLNTNGASNCADLLLHQPTVVPPIPVVDTDNIDGKYLDNSNQFFVNNVPLQTPSAESLLEKPSHSSDMSKKVDHNDNGLVADVVAKVDQSNAEGNPTLFKANSISSGNSAPNNSPVVGYSRRRSRKSVSPGTSLSSAHQTASPQSYERNTPNVGFGISPSRKSNHKISDLADAKSLRDEAITHVDRSDCVPAHTKSGLSSANPLPLNGGTDSATGTATSPLSSRDIASEAATVSDLGKNSTGSQPIEVNGKVNCDVTVNHTVRQKFGSSKKKLLSYRTSLKLANSSEVEKLPEIFANETITESLAKAKELAHHEVAAEKACAISPFIDSESEKARSSFSRQNRNIETSNAPQINSIEMVAMDSQHDKEASHATMEASAKIVSTSRVKNTGAKRSRNATNGAQSSFARRTSFGRRKNEIATSKSKQLIGSVVSHENVEAEPGKDCTSLNAAECTSFPEEILGNKARNVATSSLNANSEMNDVPGASKTESANVISQGNMNKNPRKLSSSASDNDYQRSSSEKVPNGILRSAVANVSRPADIKMAGAPTADKAKTVSFKSSFCEAVPQVYTEKLSSSASADNRETRAPDRVPNNRVRKAVAKRKVSGAEQNVYGSEPSNTSGVFPSEAEVLTIKWVAESSTNAGKAMAEKNLQSVNEDGMTNEAGSFCKDSFEDRSKDTQNFNPRSSKKKKIVDLMDGAIGHNKENIPVSGNLTPKSKYGNKCVSSKCIKKSVQNGRGVLCDRSMGEGNDCGTLSLLEPTWFILSGYRLQRKDYISILRRLKGRVCRGSHHWSYQATHFIAPELRRTEKFFAAAAAGRWILKSDYLSACNEAGKFVEEEPFEWHGDGLNNGDTISLDAPRKWRQLRQRTGHGAFYGMKIIIYGECISPSLDTLKRALRAGDATILATSPPYTRLLKHDVTFAVVSAGVASTDAWVEEFMSHNIPCVSADYLVEYVCKPGHPLNKHVLFNMHDLADKSLQKLQNSQQDGLGTGGEDTEGGDSDPSCSACGSSNRKGLQC